MANAIPVHSQGKKDESKVAEPVVGTEVPAVEPEVPAVEPEVPAGGVVQGHLPVDPRGVALDTHQAFRKDN